MTFVVQKSRNPMLNAAWAGFKKEQRGEKKAAPEPAPVKADASIPKGVAAKKPAAKKPAKPPRAKGGKTRSK